MNNHKTFNILKEIEANICIAFESRSWWGVLNTTLCDKVCQLLAADSGFLRFPLPIKLTAIIKLKYCWKWR